MTQDRIVSSVRVCVLVSGDVIMWEGVRSLVISVELTPGVRWMKMRILRGTRTIDKDVYTGSLVERVLENRTHE